MKEKKRNDGTGGINYTKKIKKHGKGQFQLQKFKLKNISFGEKHINNKILEKKLAQKKIYIYILNIIR